jgi:hypothetical protein
MDASEDRPRQAGCVHAPCLVVFSYGASSLPMLTSTIPEAVVISPYAVMDEASIRGETCRKRSTCGKLIILSPVEAA